MRRRIFQKFNIFIITILFMMPILLGKNYNVKASEDKPKITVENVKYNYEALADEDIEIKYKVKPEDINVKDVVKPSKKEIVLVIDTSGSMKERLGYVNNGWDYWEISRIDALKVAAKNFVAKFKNDNNVKIGIVTYDFKGKIHSGFMNASTEQGNLESSISKIPVEGATNIGDGIRVATDMFSSSDSKKYLILMSDGMPTALTYSGIGGCTSNHIESRNGKYGNDIYNWSKCFEKSSRWNYYSDGSSRNVKYGSYGNIDPKGYCLEYSKLMASRSMEKGIVNYVIGFSGGSDGDKLMQINNSGGGAYFDAKDADAINEVYSKIGDEIKSDYVVENVKFEFSLPESIELSGKNSSIAKIDNKYVKSIENIKYTLNSSKDKYIAEPFDISLTVKGKEKGSYKLASKLAYNNIYGKRTWSDINDVNINIKGLDIDFDVSRRILPDGDKGQMNLNGVLDIEYTINPKPIKIEKTKKPKEIMLVVDTSGSMLWKIDKREEGKPNRMELTKKALRDFIDKFKGIDNVRIGITSYKEQGVVRNFGSEENPQYFIDAKNTKALYSAIDNLEAGGGTNIGDGIRKGLAALSINKDYDKYMVIMSDGEPSTYTWIYEEKRFYTDIDLSYNYKVGYINSKEDEDWNKSLEYSNIMAQQMKDNKDLNIKSFAIGFSSEANQNKLNEIATNAGAIYFDATKNDVNAINNVYLEIADKIRADFTLDNVTLKETLPEGLVLVENNSNSINKNVPINYNYNKDKGQYEAEPVKVILKVRASKLGEYMLDGDAKLESPDIKEAKVFNKLKISVTDDYILRQGLFQPKSEVTGDKTGESNIKYLDKEVNIVKDTIVRLGAFIRTTGEEATVSIEINNNKINEIKSLNNISVNVYKVAENGELKLVSTNPNVSASEKNYAKIDVTLPKGVSGYNYYIVNYNFSANVEKEEVKMSNTCKIENLNKVEELNINFAALPDVF